jgi:hypothetical protein
MSQRIEIALVRALVMTSAWAAIASEFYHRRMPGRKVWPENKSVKKPLVRLIMLFQN